jgi:ABC-type multidrug transport system fused ATPase/permease subunit
MTSMAFNEPFFFNVSDNLIDETSAKNTDISYAVVAKEKLPVTREVKIDGITYHYPNSDKLIFDNASVSFPIGKSIGIVGPSGAGKTTVIDILLGLLNLQGGRVLADDVDIKTHYREWLANVGYIPQMIFLLDADIRKNVAFGIPEEEIDDDKLWYALKEAQLDEFVKTLPEGVHTGIGERGIRLSGGQRQRIGIARALYNDPEVLILDEATSALDNDTEAAIMDSVNRLHGKKTLIIIAHRLQTIEKCDMVYRVENGQITKER